MSKFKDMIIDVQDSIICGQLTFKQIADVYGLSYNDVNLIAEDLMGQYAEEDESGLTFFDSEYEERV